MSLDPAGFTLVPWRRDSPSVGGRDRILRVGSIITSESFMHPNHTNRDLTTVALTRH